MGRHSTICRSALGAVVVTLVLGATTATALAAEKPVVKTKAATSVSDVEEVLHGSVNPEGLETGYYFEYGTASYEKKTSEAYLPAGTSEVEVVAPIAGLKPSTKYMFRLVARNTDGTVDGSGLSFTSAAPPEFKPDNGQSVSGVLHTVALKFIYGTMTCESGVASGAVTGASAVGKLVLKLKGCKDVTKEGKECTVRSGGAPNEGEIVTNALRGVLGSVAAKEAASGVGLLLENEATKNGPWWEFTTSCVAGKIHGTLAAEVVTVGKKELTNQVSFAETKEAQGIKAITLASGEKAYPELLGYLESLATLEGVANLTFGEATEVT